jgi:hypothetical protein
MRSPLARLAFAALVLVLGVPALAGAEDISGTISGTKLLFEDSRLIGNVICTTTTGPCIQFGAPNIKLQLNGFTITGPANPDDSATCQPTSGLPAADGIANGINAATSQPGVKIVGPGMVQKFRRHGILIVGAAGVSTGVTVRQVTSHHNCFSGLLTNTMTNSVIEEIVSVRNAANSGGAPCGANCLINSNNNHIRRSQFSGNGSVCPTAVCVPGAATVASNNDFGVGLIGTSAGNVIEFNHIGGNSNGVLIQAGATGNTIRENVIAGNPPSQVSRTFGPVGFDIKDEATAVLAGRNTFERNWCISYFGPSDVSPCPSFPVTAPPEITSLSATPDVLWPANKRMVSVVLTPTVTDDNDPDPACQITDVTANESISTGLDWITTGPLTLTLNADRGGLGTGRIYTVTVMCTNNAGLSSTGSATVTVPHDQRQN